RPHLSALAPDRGTYRSAIHLQRRGAPAAIARRGHRPRRMAGGGLRAGAENGGKRVPLEGRFSGVAIRTPEIVCGDRGNPPLVENGSKHPRKMTDEKERPARALCRELN